MTATASSRFRAATSKLGGVFAGTGLLNGLIASAAVPLALLPAAPAQAQLLGSCAASLASAEMVATAGGLATTTLSAELRCTQPMGNPEPVVARACLRVEGGGNGREVRLQDESAAIPYTLALAEDGNQPLPAGTFVDIGQVAIPPGTGSDPDIVATANLGAEVEVPGTPPRGRYADTITGEIYFEDAELGAVCAGGGDILSNVSPFTATLSLLAPSACIVASTTTVNFGNVGIASGRTAETEGLGGVLIDCALGTEYTVYLGPGASPDGGLRRMSNGLGEMLPYQLYKPDGAVWDETGMAEGQGGAGGVSGQNEGAPQSYPVRGIIPGGLPVPRPGTYTDSVLVTVVY